MKTKVQIPTEATPRWVLICLSLDWQSYSIVVLVKKSKYQVDQSRCAQIPPSTTVIQENNDNDKLIQALLKIEVVTQILVWKKYTEIKRKKEMNYWQTWQSWESCRKSSFVPECEALDNLNSALTNVIFRINNILHYT